MRFWERALRLSELDIPILSDKIPGRFCISNIYIPYEDPLASVLSVVGFVVMVLGCSAFFCET